MLRETSVFQFETEQLVGVIRPGDEFPHHGLTRLRHKPTGVEFVHPLYSILNLFRILGVAPEQGTGLGRDLGQPRTEPHRVEAAGNTVTLRWPASERRRADTVLEYALGEPNRIDIAVRVRADAAYGAFEVFLASYYHPDLLPYVYLARDRFELTDEPGRFVDEPELVPVVMNDVFRGGVLVFPRDEAAARLCVDGRWDGIARFSPVRRYKVPVCFQTDRQRRVAAVWMARSEECFAVSAGYDSPDTHDRFKKHNPQYLSFFGEPARAGEERSARARLVITELDEVMSQPLALYEDFLRE